MKINIKQGLLVTAGIISVGLATIGIFLPLLPTTPFLLLAAACFVRSSDRLYNWLINHKWFGTYIRIYREHKAITKRGKIIIFLLFWVTIGYTTFWIMNSIVIQIFLLIIGVSVSVFILRLKTITHEMISENKYSNPSNK